jgi:outer membrane protein TolC
MPVPNMPPSLQFSGAPPNPTPSPQAVLQPVVRAVAQPEQVRPAQPELIAAPNANLIDLPTALQLADGNNVQVALAREQIRQAWAKVDGAKALWLPSVRVGADYNKHEGQIQDIRGQVFPLSRGNFYTGLGAGVPAAASPSVPGLYANFHLADALFQPLAARQAAGARQQAAVAATNDVLLKVSLAYLELLRTAQDWTIAVEASENSRQLVQLTSAYASSGQGLQADADRARTEYLIRRNDTLRTTEARQVASARLAQLLRLDATVELTPFDPRTVPIDLVSPETPVGELVAQGLSARPELAESRFLVGQAVQKMRRERFAALIPSVVLGASYGGFGGAPGGALNNYAQRMDADVIAYWELRNMGRGDLAARNETRSLVRQANVQQMATMDLVAREVAEAWFQITARHQQIAAAQEAVEAALASHQRNLERIRGVQGLPIEVLQSNQALAQARREYLRAVIDYNTAQFTLYRALGWPAKIP